MDWSAICKSFLALLFGAALTAAGGCSDKLDTEDPGSGSGYLTLNFNISGSPSRGEQQMAGEDEYHENTFSTLDLFFYTTTADENTAAVLHHHASGLSGSSAQLGLGNFQDLIDHPQSTFKVIAIANCTETKNLDKPTIGALKATVTKAEGTQAFRAKEAPSNFVMTNFDNPSEITFNEAEDASGTLTFKRVAAKIRVAIDLPESIEQDGKKWTPDLDDMRVYFTSGVHKARLDGKQEGLQLTDDDYYNIATSGQKETEDYYCARQLADGTEDKNKVEGMVDGETYKYVNALPLYTYPATWEDTMFETHQPTVIVVVAWETGAGDEKTYKPSYYAMPVNKAGKIVSNAYYYLRAKIDMMGSDSPLQPLEVDMECEIADWGSAEETTADIRPIRFLQFNQTAFVVNNERSITIPFYSSHNIKEVEFTCTYYLYNDYGGVPQERWFNSSVSVTNGSRDDLYKIEIDNQAKTVTFSHNLFSTWSTYPALTTGYSSRRQTTSFTKGGTSESTTSRKLYTQFFVELKVRHSDQPEGTEYEETIYLTLNPPIYVSTIYVDDLTWGGILLNGYGRSNGETGELGGFTGSGGSDNNSDCLTVISITQLDGDEGWVLDDPRMMYINNEMDNTSISSDVSDHLTVWTYTPNRYNSAFGAYEGTSNSFWTTAGECRTIWEYYSGPAWSVNWSGGVWKPQEDPGKRGLQYYYPAAERADRANIIGPKLIFTSRHATNSATTNREEARRRCATFQQAGYPAGRWRLPTSAEIGFVKKMQSKDVITNVFVGATNYWSSQGYTNNQDGAPNGTGGSHYARCVYDAWYWEQVDAEGNRFDDRIPEGDNKINWTYFTYGDRPREAYLNSPATYGGGPIVSDKYTVERYLEMHKGVRPVENNR